MPLDAASLTCADCRFWAGRCLKGNRNVFACSPACGSISLSKGASVEAAA